MKKRNVYSGDFKARVVIESIQGNKSLMELAKDYSLHPNQIKNWKSLFLKNAKYVLEDKRIKTFRASDVSRSM